MTTCGKKIKVFHGNPPPKKKAELLTAENKVFCGEPRGLPSVLSIHEFSNYRSAVVF